MFADRIIKQLFHEESLSAVPLDKLQQLADEYPYFTQGQLLLAQKQLELDQMQAPEWQKLQMFVSNPFVLQQLKISETEVPVSADPIPDNELANEKGETVLSFPDEAAEDDNNTDVEDEIIAETAEINNTVEESAEEEIVPSADLVTEEQQDEEIEKDNEVDDQVATDEIATESEEQANGQLIQPLFTRDYFAHQGINLPEQIDDSKPPTSAQLRSFTDWLRTTKRPKGAINPDEAASPTTRSSEDEDAEVPESVKRMADGSNQQEKILTEAMAEILVKQGHIVKATEIYEKLSLQNPEKSSYFAQKIADIKASN